MKDKITSQIAALQRGIDSLTLYEGKQVKRISHIHIEKIRAVCATTKADCADYILAPIAYEGRVETLSLAKWRDQLEHFKKQLALCLRTETSPLMAKAAEAFEAAAAVSQQLLSEFGHNWQRELTEINAIRRCPVNWNHSPEFRASL